MANHDRVNEVYYGKIYSQEFQRLTRDRIHWICKQVVGERVLDIGCSQGITSILLGREGFKVTAIDIEEQSIEYARHELEKEEEHTKRNIEFIHGNALHYEFQKEYFDTIILAEVIEHLVQPQRLYKKVWDLLTQQGRVIITTPFGILDHDDHKTTYYLSNLLKEIHPYFGVKKVHIIGKWICVVGEKKQEIENEELKVIDIRKVEMSEEAFYNIQRKLLDISNQRHERITQLQNKINQMQDKLKQTQQDAQKREEYQQLYIQLQQELKQEKERERKLKEDIHLLEEKQKELLNREQLLKKAVDVRDKNILALRKRIAVIEQSTKFKLGSYIVNSLLRPWTIPNETYRTLRWIAGSLKRKVKNQKQKYKLPDLPYPVEDIYKTTVKTRSQNKKPNHLPVKKINEKYLKELNDTSLSIQKLRVAAILDDFSYQCFKEDCQLIIFKPENWREILTIEHPHLLFVESAWKGNGGSWQYKIARYNLPQGNELDELLEWCRQQNIPTVFWNKEDPVHFEEFIDTAKKFDYIFTTDENCIPRYKEIVNHDRVYALPFAAQPAIHNPIKITDKRIDKICFAGSYYSNRHPERKRDMEDILDIADEFGLVIYDRNYKENQKGPTDFSFPERYQKNIVGSLEYDEIDIAYKGYKVMLNVNSVKDSPTMFSRRVFEGLACGTPIVSSYSIGIKKIFKDIVLLSENAEELRQKLSQLMNDTDLYRQKSLEGIREVYLKHTYKHRIKYVLEKLGIEIDIPAPKVSVVSIAESSDEFNNIYKSFISQTWSNKELVVFLTNFEGYIDILNQYNKENVRVYVLSYMDHYSRITDIIKSDFLAFFAPNNFYGENYLLDLMIGTEYSRSDIIGKANYYAYNKSKQLEEFNTGKEYEYTDNLYMDSAITRPEIYKGEEVVAVLNKMRSCESLKPYFEKGFRLFSCDKFNFIKDGLHADELIKNKVEK